MGDRQAREVEWVVAGDDGSPLTWERVQVAVLMDIRRELRTIRGLLQATLGCTNFKRLPAAVNRIARATEDAKPVRVPVRRRA